MRAINHGRSDVPDLFIKSVFDAEGYEIHLTDLSRVWAERLSKREINQRAIESYCSIDLSADRAQYGIFTDKLRDAIEQQAGSSIELSVDEAGDGIQLSLSAELPPPLPPLKWQAFLKGPRLELIRPDLVDPLLAKAQGLEAQLGQLLDELRAKDHVITRLSDRLEASGTPLSEVFPNVSNVARSKKLSQREQLAQHIRGLGEFDQGAWRSRSAAERSRGDFTGKFIEGTFGSIPCASSSSSKQTCEAGWYEMLSGIHSIHIPANPDKVTKRSVSPVPKPLPAVHQTSRDDGFQRQTTPDRLKASKVTVPTRSRRGDSEAAQPTLSEGHNDDSSTDDEDLDDAPGEPHARDSHKTPAPASPAKPKLGAMGGRKRNVAWKDTDADNEQTPEPIPSREKRELQHEPASEALSESEPKSQTTPNAAKFKGKLGTIGGKSKQTSAPVRSDEQPEESLPAPEQVPKPGTKRFGTIGGIRSAGTSDQVKVEPSEGIRSREGSGEATARREITPPEEPSEERADRKRNELKRALAQKAKAPTKKKRKF